MLQCMFIIIINNIAYFFLPGCKVVVFYAAVHFSFSLKYGRNERRTANFSIGIDLLGPDPTAAKIKPNLKKLASCAFCKFVEDQLQQILAERHSLGTEKTPTGHQQHLKAKFPF